MRRGSGKERRELSNRRSRGRYRVGWIGCRERIGRRRYRKKGR